GKDFSAETSIRVTPTANGFGRFNLASTVPSWACSVEIDKATLLLWVKSLDNPGYVDVGLNTNDWSASSLTWSNQPYASYYKSVQVTTAGQYVVIDMTEAVRAWVNRMNTASGECNGVSMEDFGVTLTANPQSPARVVFDSRAAGGVPPVIDITLF